MTEEQARAILRGCQYACIIEGDDTITLDGDFTAQELEALLCLLKLGVQFVSHENR